MCSGGQPKCLGKDLHSSVAFTAHFSPLTSLPALCSMRSHEGCVVIPVRWHWRLKAIQVKLLSVFPAFVICSTPHMPQEQVMEHSQMTASQGMQPFKSQIAFQVCFHSG